MIKISLNSIFVDDQQKALDFYTDKIGFHKKEDVPIGEHRWITVCNKGDEFELVFNIDAKSKVFFGDLSLDLPSDYDLNNFTKIKKLFNKSYTAN